MSLPKLKKTCNFIQLGILSKKKKITLYNTTKKIDSLLRVFCQEGLLQTFTRMSGNQIVIYPRYNSQGYCLFSEIKVIPKSNQIYPVKFSLKQKYTQHIGEIFVFYNKKEFFTFKDKSEFTFTDKSKQGGRHILTIR